MSTTVDRGAGNAKAKPAPVPRPLDVWIVAGIDDSDTVQSMLTAPDMTEAAILRLEPKQQVPANAAVLRLETADGRTLNHPDTFRHHWHRSPYVMALRLVRYAAGSTSPVVIDEAVIGTRGERAEVWSHVEHVALHLLHDAVLGRSRGPTPRPLFRRDDTEASGPGWLDHLCATWARRVQSEHWAVGMSPAPLDRIVGSGDLGPVCWLTSCSGSAYVADPFPWPGTGRVLCEEMPRTGEVGRIIALAPCGLDLVPSGTILKEAWHHSYPCTFQDGTDVYMIAEATERGATMLYRLEPTGALTPACMVAPDRCLADPTLFAHDGLFWIACTDLDLGLHDNLCLLYADSLTGPWHSHRLLPVRFDVRGARPAGSVFRVDGHLFRPGQDCSSTYGAAITIHRIDVLTPCDYRETAVSELRPDPDGPYPHGLHTLSSDGARVWVDGKRHVVDWSALTRKLARRVWRGGGRRR